MPPMKMRTLHRTVPLRGGDTVCPRTIGNDSQYIGSRLHGMREAKAAANLGGSIRPMAVDMSRGCASLAAKSR